MASVAGLLRQMDLIESSKRLNALQKASFLKDLQRQLDELSAQMPLVLPPGGDAEAAPQAGEASPAASGPSYGPGTVKLKR